MKLKPPIDFDLLSNARDSLRHAVELLVWKDIGSEHSRLKHAIVNSAHGIELLLKERLHRVNPALVLENVNEDPSIEAKTVTAATAIARLKKHGGVTFTSDDEAKLKSLRTTRNAIEHYRWRTTEKEAKVIIGHALSFAVSFANDELGTDLTAEFKRDDTWRVFVEELYDFARAHGAKIEAKLRSKGEYPACCDSCGELAVPARGGSCELCGHWQAVDEDS